MTIKELLRKTKILLSEVKLSIATLKDGIKISYEGDYIDVGSIIYTVDEAGNEIVLADGSYETEDGFKFSIKDGKVDSVTKSNVEEMKTEEEKLQLDPKEVETIKAYIDEKYDMLRTMIEEMKNLYEEIKGMHQASSTEMNSHKEALSKITKAVELLSNEPAEKSAEEVISDINSPNKNKGNKLTKIKDLYF